MEKFSRTHYYAQIKEEGKPHEILCHTYDEETKEYYHKFMDKKKAQELIDNERPTHANTTKFRVVKCVERYEIEKWG